MKTTIRRAVGVLATEAVQSSLQKAASYEKAVIQDRDPEDLHQMRVNLRRLRTAMQVFAPSIRLPKSGDERQVAKVARRLGTLRDLDVIVATLRDQYVPDLPDVEHEKLAVIFQYLDKKRRKAYKQVKAELKGDRYDQLKTSLQEWSLSPNCNATARLDINAVLPDLALPLVSRLWLHPGWLVGIKETKGTLKPDTRMGAETVNTLVADASNTLHSLRKQVKRVRYQLKFISEFYGDRLDAELTRFSKLQDLLGELQDSLVLETYLQKAFPQWETALPTLKALLAHNRYRAWQQWQTHQQDYLEPQNRAALRQILLVPEAATAAVEATPKAKPAKKKPSSGSRKRTTSKSGQAKSPGSARANKKSGNAAKAADTDHNGAS